MSGIFAIISRKNKNNEINEKNGDLMLDGLTVYGRECRSFEKFETEGGQILSGSCISGLGRTRRDRVPVTQTQRYIAVCDAVIYNRDEMLTAAGETTEICDERLLVLVYERLGKRGLLRLNGDFAAVLFDRKDGSVHLIRDHIGVRPLYYVQTEECLTVSTDYRPMLHLPYIKAQINETMIYDVLTMGSVASETDTVFANVKKAVHGSVTRFSAPDSAGETERFYIPGKRKAKKQGSDEAYYAEAARLLRDAVRVRYEACAGEKCGCEFSGGLDSGMVTALVDEIAVKSGGEKPLVLTWSPSLKEYEMRHTAGGPVRDEREVISRFCSEKNLECIFRDTKEALNAERIEKRGRREEICEYDTGIIADTMESFASNGIRVIWSGWGGDEGISMRFSPYHLAQKGEFPAYFKAARFAAQGSPKKFLGFVKRTARFMYNANRPWNGMKANDLSFNVLQPAFEEDMRHTYVPKRKYFGTYPEKNMLSGTLESRTLLSASAGADAGVMYLFPLLDARVLDYALTVPRRLFISEGEQRVLPQRALRDILPEYLTKFAGTSNVEKEDTGRMDFFTEVEERAYSGLGELFLDKIDRLLFEEYIDFDVMEKTLREEPDPLVRTLLRNMLRVLYKMQLLMKDSDKGDMRGKQ